MTRVILVVTTLSLWMTSMASCGTGGRSGPQDPAGGDPATTVVVRFHDSSVPPEYHRSWTLRLSDQRISLVVDSYGDVVARETAPMPRRMWADFVAGLDDELAALPDPVEGEVCPGGTSVDFEVTQAGDELTSLVVPAPCEPGTDVNGEVTDRIMTLVTPFTKRVHLQSHTR